MCLMIPISFTTIKYTKVPEPLGKNKLIKIFIKNTRILNQDFQSRILMNFVTSNLPCMKIMILIQHEMTWLLE